MHALGSLVQHNQDDQSMELPADRSFALSAFPYHGATVQRVDRTAQQPHHPTPGQDAIRRVPQGAAGQN